VANQNICNAKRTLIVFIKSPVPGDVKTRLIPFLTSTEAAELYKCFVVDTLRTLLQITAPLRLLVAYQLQSKAADLGWLGMKNPPEFFKQEGRSLGEKLIHAFGVAFGRGSQQVVIIGSDSPTVPKAYIEQAFGALSGADVVLGPALDGGYYLIGLSRPCLKLFEDVCWSTDHVFERTARNAESQGYTLRVLPSHYDIDTIEDVAMLRHDLAKDAQAAPTTRKYLDQLTRSNPALGTLKTATG